MQEEKQEQKKERVEWRWVKPSVEGSERECSRRGEHGMMA
jgi:hypothetical protein